jgi:hypothetical protein
LQALRDLHYPRLQIELHPAALTLEQVRALNLPSTPLKESERRADHWRAVMDHEQTEIDALIALRPDALREIVTEAIVPFYDPTLAERTEQAQHEWEEQAAQLLHDHPNYQTSRVELEHALADLRTAADRVHTIQNTIRERLTDLEPRPVVVPDPEIFEDAPEPLFSCRDD